MGHIGYVLICCSYRFSGKTKIKNIYIFFKYNNSQNDRHNRFGKKKLVAVDHHYCSGGRAVADGHLTASITSSFLVKTYPWWFLLRN